MSWQNALFPRDRRRNLNIPTDHIRRQHRDISRFLLSPILYHGYRLFIGVLFLYAGATKLADTAGFTQSIEAYRILPDPLVPCAVLGLPLVEVVAGLGTLLNRRWAVLCILGMMILFLGVLGYGVAVGLDIDCGCFSKSATVAEATESVGILDLPDSEGSGIDSTLVQIEPDPGTTADDGTCSEESKGPARLRAALFRDILLFLGVVYLVAWPDLRKRFSLKPNDQSPK